MRFGRIPKREKQRMLLEMQSAMNNMMNNNQLHTQLHGNQTEPPSLGNPSPSLGNPSPPCPVEVPAKDASPTPTSSSSPGSSPRSSQSDSSAEPDPEPSMSMDTSGTESGEEEVIGTVTRAHQETFMYNQEQASPSTESQRSPSANENAHNDSKTMEEKQNVWNNYRNNVATVTDHNNRLAPSSQPDTSEGLRVMDNTPRHCPMQMPNAAPSGHCPVTGHSMPHRALNNRDNGFRGPAWRGGNRMYLVSTAMLDTSVYWQDSIPVHSSGKK